MIQYHDVRQLLTDFIHRQVPHPKFWFQVFQKAITGMRMDAGIGFQGSCKDQSGRPIVQEISLSRM